MRVAAFTDLVGPDGVSILERPAPEPAPDEAVVGVEACSLNRHDLSVLQGESAMADRELPFVSGLDAAGVVRSIGADVDGIEPGDRVVHCPNRTCGSCRFCREGPENLCTSLSLFHGAFAESVSVDADRLIRLPDGVDATSAAALPTAYLTAFHMLRRADVGAGDLVFVPGVTGGVGVAAVQLADVMGAHTVGTSTSPSKLDRLEELGLDHAVSGSDPDRLREEVAAVGTPDAVINHLGGPYTDPGLDLLRRGGTMVVCGRTAGRTSEIDVSSLALGHKRLVGSSMGTQPELERLVELVADGTLSPAVDGTYPLADTDEAFAAMQSREFVGKIVVTPR